MKNIITKIITYICLAAVSVGFLYAFSLWTSPNYEHWYGCDASFFTLVGRGILSGMVPYRDFYDLKGPYFFFIQALGQFIRKGHVGLFILQAVALWASLVLIYKLGRLYISHKKTLGIIVFFLLAYISLLWGGNCLEEFTLPMNLLVIYLNLKYLIGPKIIKTAADSEPDAEEKTEEKRNLSLYLCAAITGLCFTIMTFSKVTAGAPLIGLCVGILILMMKRKQFKDFAFYALYFLLGAVVGFVPLLIYFGYHGCILKMLYCTFIFGFKRSSDLSRILSWELETKVSGATFAAIFALLHLLYVEKGSGTPDIITEETKAGPEKNTEEVSTNSNITAEKTQVDSDKNTDIVKTSDTDERKEGRIKKWLSRIRVREECILLFPMSIVTYLALHLGDGFIYYFITGMPCMVLALILFAKIYDPLILFKTVKQSVCWLLIFVFVYHYTGPSINSFKTFRNRPDEAFQQEYYKNSLDMGALIPSFDRDRVFSFDIDMQWYEINDILPCNKYVVNLQYFIALEPGIEQELFDFFEKTPPKWMICSNTLEDYLPQMNEMVQSKYDCLFTTDVGHVYLLRE